MLRFATLSAALLTVSMALAFPTSLGEVHFGKRNLGKRNLGKRCVATINSPSDVTPSALACTTININSFTMTAGKTLALTGLANNATINLLGDVTFGFKNWNGPLMTIATKSPSSLFTFNGNGYNLNGQGQLYWDGKGSNGGVTKPNPMLSITRGGGLFEDVTILNSPTHAFTIHNTAPITVTGVNVDNSAGASLGHNTDCFNVGGTGVTLTNNTCINQDDCIGILYGSAIKFSSNVCTGGHGVSIGSVASGQTVSDVTISDNKITSSANGLRIKTVYGATSAAVTNIVYSNNHASDISQYGIVIQQDYENGSPTGKPSNGVTLGPIMFKEGNVVSVNSKAKQVYVLCGTKCTGNWEWSGLNVSGGTTGSSNYDNIVGFAM
jgi:galacturan 1,4-alpha-galacturonidase